jgi:hypothetical protein
LTVLCADIPSGNKQSKNSNTNGILTFLEYVIILGIN